MEPVNIDGVTFRQLEICIAVMEQRSFTDAANALFISQPSISKQIANLEQSLGVKLFTRGKNTTVTPTPAGKQLITGWRSMLTDFQREVTEAAESQRRNNRVITLYLTPSTRKDLFLTSILREFLKAYPDTFPHVNFGAPQKGLNEVIDGTSDIMIYNPYQREFNAGDKIRSEWLVHTPWAVGMLNTNPLSQMESLTWGDLREMRFILPNSSVFIQTINDHCIEFGFHPQIAYLCNLYTSIASNVCRDDEVFITDRFMVDYGRLGYTFFDLTDESQCGLKIMTRGDESDEQVLYLKELLLRWFSNFKS